MSLGRQAFAQKIIADNVRLFSESGVKTVVAISPHCFDMFQNHYPKESAGFRVLHYTQLLAGLIEKKRLVFENQLPIRVAYHDPCYLGRGNGEYEAPRAILRAIGGIETVELDENREEALCCGGGGGRMWMETESKERFSNLRVSDAVSKDIQVLATACPFCIACLEDSAKMANAKMEVMDVAEIAAWALNPSSYSLKSGPLTDREVDELSSCYLKEQTGG